LGWGILDHETLRTNRLRRRFEVSSCRTRVQEFQIEKRHSCGEFDPRAPPSIATVARRSLVLEVFFEIKHGKLASKSRLSGSAKNISWLLEENTCASV
jgi:hypothetical protein